MSDDLQEAFKKAFTLWREEAGFTTSLSELDTIFMLQDHLEREGYVSTHVDQQVMRRLTDVMYNYAGYLHRLIMPNPHNIIEATEAGYFTEHDQQRIINTIQTIMEYVARNNQLSLPERHEGQARFIDDAIPLWNNIQPELAWVADTIQAAWKEKTIPSPQ